jgi:hypothetical protein
MEQERIWGMGTRDEARQQKEIMYTGVRVPSRDHPCGNLSNSILESGVCTFVPS